MSKAILNFSCYLFIFSWLSLPNKIIETLLQEVAVVLDVITIW